MKYNDILRSNLLEEYLKNRCEKRELEFLKPSFRKVSLALNGNDYNELFDKYIAYVASLIDENMKNEEILVGDSIHNFYYICMNLDKMSFAVSTKKSVDDYTDDELRMDHSLEIEITIVLRKIEKFFKAEVPSGYYNDIMGYMEFFLKNECIYEDKTVAACITAIYNDLKEELSENEILVANAIILDIYYNTGFKYISWDDRENYYHIDTFIEKRKD